MNQRAAFLRALLLTAVTIPSAACGDSSSTAQGGGGSTSVFFPCEDPKPMDVDGKSTGYEVCAGGTIHRKEVQECPSLLPRPNVYPSVKSGEDCTDAGCKDAPNGFCKFNADLSPAGYYCKYGCTKDTDCGEGSICLCGDPVGQCISAGCKSDQECGGGMCTSYGHLDPICPGMLSFACQSPDDACGSSKDCPMKDCLLEGDHRVCKEGNPCAIGRPLFVEEELRAAPLLQRADW